MRNLLLMRLKLVLLFILFGFGVYAQDFKDVDKGLSVDTLEVIKLLERDGCAQDKDTLFIYLSKLSALRCDSISARERASFARLFSHIADLLVDNDSPEAAMTFANKALQCNPQDGWAKLVLARIMLLSGNADSAYGILKQVYGNISSGAYSRVIGIAGEVAQRYSEKILSLMHQGQYLPALTYARIVDTLLMMYPTADTAFKTLFKSLLLRVYGYELELMKRDLDWGRYDSALVRLGYIEDFCRRYSYVFSADERMKHSDNLKYVVFQAIDRSLKDRRIYVALKFLNGYYNLCEVLNDKECLSLLDNERNRVYREIFGYRLSRMRNLWRQKDIKSLIFLIKETDDFVKKYNIQDISQYQKLKDSVYLYQVSSYVKLLQIYLHSKQYDSAFSILNLLTSDKELARYMPDTLINYYPEIVRKSVIASLSDTNISKNKLFDIEEVILKNNLADDTLVRMLYLKRLKRLSYECAYKHELFFSNLRQYQLSLLNRDFLGARAILEKTLKLSDSLCPLPEDTVITLLNDLSAAVTYDLLQKQIFEAFKNKDYQKSFEFLLAAQKYYHEQALSRFGMPQPDLYQTIISFNLPFVLYAARELVYLDSLQLAYDLLKYANSQGVPATRTKDIQKELGFRLAVHDFTLNPYENLRKSLRRYKRYHPWWFRYMIKQYIRQRSRMKAFKF